MKQSLKIIGLMKRNIGTLLVFEMVYKLCTIAIVTPLLKAMFNLSISAANISYMGLENIKTYLLNPFTMLLLVMIVILLGFGAMFEISCILYCLNQSWKKEKAGILQMVHHGYDRMVGVLQPKNWFVFLWMLLLIPLINTRMSIGMIQTIKIPSFIMDYIKADQMLHIFYTGFTIFVSLVLTYGMFTFNFYVLKNDSFMKSAWNSIKAVRGHFFSYTLRSIIGYMLVCAMFLIPLIILIVGGDILLLLLAYSRRTVQFFIVSLMIIPVVYIIFSTFFGTALIYASMSVFYFERFGAEEIKPVPDQVKKKLRIGILSFVILAVVVAAGEQLVPKILKGHGAPVVISAAGTTVTAHRGSDLEYPENTITAFQAAVDAKTDWIETDVHQTKDGVVIISHDSNLKRVTGQNVNTYDLTLDEIKKLDAGSFRGAQFAGEPIPTLEELFQFAQKYPELHLNVELKPTGHEPGMEQKCVDLIHQYGLEDRCILASLQYDALERVKQYDESIKCAYLMAMGLGKLEKIPYADIISIESSFVNKSMITRCHEAGVAVFAWTINEETTMETMVNLGVDSIITDDPVLARYTVNQIDPENRDLTIAKVINMVRDTADSIIAGDVDDDTPETAPSERAEDSNLNP